MIGNRQDQLGERWSDKGTIAEQRTHVIGASESGSDGTGADANAPLETPEAATVGRPYPTVTTPAAPESSAGPTAPTDAPARRIGEAQPRVDPETTVRVNSIAELTRRPMSALIGWFTPQPSLPPDDEAARLGVAHR